MTAADFDKIKARFPCAAVAALAQHCHHSSRRRAWAARVYRDGGQWRWEMMRQIGPNSYQTVAENKTPRPLGRCLRSLECAILREAKTLAGMVGKDVTT